MGVVVDGGLAAAVIGSLITEFTGVAGIGELYGLSRGLTLPLSAAALLAIVATGSYRRVERTAIVIGLFELAFFAVAWAARPSPSNRADARHLAKPIGLGLDGVEDLLAEGLDHLLGIDRADAPDHAGAVIFLIPSIELGAEALRKRALNC